MIVVENLTKRFGERDAVQGVTFNVERGEILGFLGPNGAGKTTTMRMLTCYFPPTSGRAEVAGFDVMKDSLEVRKRVGYMPENVPLYHDMPVDAYLGFVAQVKDVPARDRRAHIELIMEETSLTEVRGYPIGKISRGFRQRVGLAQAIVGTPEVLILDEPTVGLDPRQIVEIRALIRKLAAKSTVILSTHIMQEVESLCNRVVIIDGGRIRAVDTVDRLRNRPSSGTVVEVVVAGATIDAVTTTLERIDGVSKVKAAGSEGEAARFEVEVTGPRAVIGAISAAIVRSEWSLLEVHPRSASLEDVFIRVVSHDDTADAGTEPAATAATDKKEAG